MNGSKNARRPSGASPESKARRRSRRAARAEGWNLRFESAGTRVPTAVVKDSPTLLVAVVEDLCWQLAVDDLRTRRPHRWRWHAYTDWRAQFEPLEQKRARLGDMVDDALAVHRLTRPIDFVI